MYKESLVIMNSPVEHPVHFRFEACFVIEVKECVFEVIVVWFFFELKVLDIVHVLDEGV